MLLEDLVDQLIVLDGQGNAKHVLGTYSQYIEQQQRQHAPATTTATPKPKRSSNPSPTDTKAAKPSNNRPYANPTLAKLNQQSLEKKIESLETKIADADTQLAEPDAYRDPEKVKRLQQQRNRLTQELAPLEAEWLRRAET